MYAGIVFGYDWETEDVFDQILDFLIGSNVDVLQATILTPFPGTPLFREMDRQSRIVDKDWSHYNFGNVVFKPARMHRDALRRGHARVLKTFYSQRCMLPRFFRARGYLDPGIAVRGTALLNFSYRHRLRAKGTFARA